MAVGIGVKTAQVTSWSVTSTSQWFPFDQIVTWLVPLAGRSCSFHRSLQSEERQRKVAPNWLSVWAGEGSVLFPGFLEVAQLGGRWQRDETQRQPGEGLEAKPGSGSSRVLSWSAQDKRGAACSICSSSLCLITMRCPRTHRRRWGLFTRAGRELSNIALKGTLNCV